MPRYSELLNKVCDLRLVLLLLAWGYAHKSLSLVWLRRVYRAVGLLWSLSVVLHHSWWWGGAFEGQAINLRIFEPALNPFFLQTMNMEDQAQSHTTDPLTMMA
jgi:hypothetical protein